MKRLSLVALIAAIGAHGVAAKAVPSKLPPAKTLATVPGLVESFGQDGDHLVWARAGDCGKSVELRTLSTGASRFLDARNGPMCQVSESAGGLQPPMALAGTRALWAYMNVSLSHYNYSVFTAGPGNRERVVSEMSIEGGMEDDDGSRLATVPMAGHGGLLVFADINTDEGSPSGVYRLVGNRVQHVAGTEYAFAVAVAGRRFALARTIPGGCVCNDAPSWSPDARRIAFVSGRDEGGSEGRGWQLLVMNADGTNARSILRDVRAFAWSPDGSSLAAWQQGETSRLVVLKPDGSGAHTIAPGGEFEWAPDGSRIAYVSSSDSGPGRLFVVSADGGAAIDLGEASANDSPEWSADSRRVAYTRSVDEHAHVYVATVATRSAADVGLGGGATWAPDGSGLAFVRQDDGVYVARPDGSNARKVAPASWAVVRWSPDGRWLGYENDSGLWIVSLAGGAPRQLAASATSIAWSPDGGAIAYIDDRGLSVVDVPSGARRFSTPGLGGPVSWSADGSRLATVKFGADGESREIAAVDAHSGGATTLTHTDAAPARVAVETRSASGKLESTFDASPDLRGVAWGGSAFALLRGLSKGRSTIEIRTANGKPLRRVNVPHPNYDDLSMSGRWLVFKSGKTAWLLDAKTGTTKVLAREQPHMYIAGVSISGRRVAWAESRSRSSRIRAVFLPG